MSIKGSNTVADYIPWSIATTRACEIREEKPVLSAIIAFGINTGLRIGDILNIQNGDIKDTRGNGTISLREKKTGKPKIIVLNPWLDGFLSSCDLPGAGYVFSRTGLSPITPQAVNRGLKDVFGDLGIQVSSHSLRKTFGRRVMEQNNYSAEALIKLCELFNHSSPATTRIYLGLRQEELNEVYLNLI